MSNGNFKIINGDALETLKSFKDESIDCCITSPPYYNLRDYGVENQIGLEKTPKEYIKKLLDVFREVKRVLKKDGTLWVNIADSYSSSGKGAATYPTKGKQLTNKGSINSPNISNCEWGGIRPKNLIGIPWMLAFGLRDEVGFNLRQDIIWAKPNPMPESVKDRCTKAHEYIFLFSKSNKYYFDAEAIKEPAVSVHDRRLGFGRLHYRGKRDVKQDFIESNFVKIYEKRNKRDVWTIPVKPFKEAHFATFPPELIEPCIKAGCKQNGIILDPFAGAGTTGIVALENNKNFIGIELNPKYCSIAYGRVKKTEQNDVENKIIKDNKIKQTTIFDFIDQ